MSCFSRKRRDGPLYDACGTDQEHIENLLVQSHVDALPWVGPAVTSSLAWFAGWVTGLQHAVPAIVTELGWTRILATALSLATTGALMIRLNVPHPPAAATTLIVSLGVVSRPAYLVVLEVAVGLLVGQAIIVNRLTGVRYPFWASVPDPKIGVLASRGALQRFTRFLWLG